MPTAQPVEGQDQSPHVRSTPDPPQVVGGVDASGPANLDEKLADLRRPDARGDVVVGTVRARTSFVGPTSIGKVVIAGSDHSYPVPVTDLVSLHGQHPFVEPPEFGHLLSALAPGRVVVCHGPDGCGKESAIVRAMLRTGGDAVRAVPGALGVDEIGRVVESLAERHYDCVVGDPPEPTLKALTGPSGEHLRSVAVAHGVRIVISSCWPGQPSRQTWLTTVALSHPDPERLCDAYCEYTNAAPHVRALVEKVLGELPPPIAPSVVAGLVNDALKDGSDPQALSARYSSSRSDEALVEWLGDQGKGPRDLALLAAGVTLSGADTIAAREQAAHLEEVLCGESAAPAQPVYAAGSAWPLPFLQTDSRRVGTHFGVHTLDVVRVREPHRPHELLRTLWSSVENLRPGYLAWLEFLADVPRLRWHAAFSAGVLFAHDPVVLDQQVLHPWALSDNPWKRRCAGLALGTPLAIDADAGPARALANAWATGASERLNHAAVCAYGGDLGARDDSLAAPLQLMRIARRVNRLAIEAYWAIANLVTAGADAVGARTQALGYLQILAHDAREQRHAFACAPSIIVSLTASWAVCAESLAALRTEPENWRRLCDLMATALVTPSGVEPGQACLDHVVRAVAQGRVEHEFAVELISGLRDARRPHGSVVPLGEVIRRRLGALSRSRYPDVTSVASALLTQCFPGG